jgi:hypothetical protein
MGNTSGSGTTRARTLQDDDGAGADAVTLPFGTDTTSGDVVLASRSTPSHEPVQYELGSGPDTLVLEVSQDFFWGNARYIVSVDGQQFAGIFAARALHDSGERDTVILHGDWGPGAHEVTVTMVNDLWVDGVGDRNVYVNSATYNGGPTSEALGDIWYGGTFTVTGPASGGGGGDTNSGGDGTDPVAIDAGEGADTLVLEVSQDQFRGSARYTVSVDGQQVGGVFTAHALHDSGGRDTLTLHGDWGPGRHEVTVTMVNDLWVDGVGDRNVYVDRATYNGGPTSDALGDAWYGGTFTVRGPAGGGDDTSGGSGGGDIPGNWQNVWTESFDGTGHEDVLGMFSRAWGPGIDTSVSGQLTIWTSADDQDSGAMVPPWGSPDAGYGYGLYTFTLETQGTIGTYALTWPATDVWPGPELDVMEIGPDGVPYSTIHWKGEDGSNQYTSYRLEGVDPSEVHTYAMNWQHGYIDIYVDGELKHHITENVPLDYAHGGENTCPGIGVQTWWNDGALGGSNHITLYEASYSVIA